MYLDRCVFVMKVDEQQRAWQDQIVAQATQCAYSLIPFLARHGLLKVNLYKYFFQGHLVLYMYNARSA